MLAAVVGAAGSEAPAASTGTKDNTPCLARCTFSGAVSRGGGSGGKVRDASNTAGIDVLLKGREIDLLQMLLPEDSVVDREMCSKSCC